MKVQFNHDFEYDVRHLLKIFGQNIEISETPELTSLINSKEDGHHISVALRGVRLEEVITSDNRRVIKRAHARILYDVLSNVFKKESPYGTLVGVRPVKLIHEMLRQGFSEEEMHKSLYETHRISKEKQDLLIEIGKREAPFLEDRLDLSKISLYICIPFCPTRCLYCSFPSNDMRQKGHLVEEYLKCLHHEIDVAKNRIKENNLSVDCIYIGGGTPSILSVDQFENLLSKLDGLFELKFLKEFTIEAGRPDTISPEKLSVFEKYHVSRICINPQSMNDKTLNLIGRDHSVISVDEKFKLAKTYRFNSINMDLILGLPDEDIDDVKATINHIIELNPDNITIHTLAVKTSSRLKETLEKYNMTHSELVEEMLAYADKSLRAHGYVPYYMYRQKNMVGNFENVGYCKPGKESLYNIRIIEEQHSILALGAGAVSKKCYPEEDRFDRIANIKGIEDYITRIEDVIKKSTSFFER